MKKIKDLLKSGTFWGIIVSAIIAIVLYIMSEKTREPVYSIIKEPTLIFDKKNSSSKFKLILGDSTPIQNNVYVTTLLVWNNGNLEIKKEDIRKKIKVVVLNNGEILDYKITKQSHPDIANFRLEEVENELVVNWDYFDPKFGFEFQVIYSGPKDSHIGLEGYIVGSEVKKVSLLSNSKTTLFQNIFYFVVCIFLVLLTWDWFRDGKMASKILIISTIILIMYYFYNIIKKISSEYIIPF